MISRVPNRRIAAEAADWSVRIDAGPLSADEKAQLAEWLRTSPVHVDELLFSASLMAGLAHVDVDRASSVESLLTDVAPEVIPLFHEPGTSSEEEPANTDRPVAQQEPAAPRALTRYWPAIAASLLVVLASSWYGLNYRSAPTVDAVGGDSRLIAAESAEPQPIALEDGSVLYMNKESRAQVGFSEERRIVELLEGQALFDVAHDRDRPFQVLAAGTKIEALGTKFTVEHGDEGVSVAVREGKVRVSLRNDTPTSEMLARATSPLARNPLQLAAGQKAFVVANGEATVDVSTLAPTAWQMHHLSYKNENLSVIAAEFNRFNAVKIAVADPDLAKARFSGVFDAHDPETFIAFLELSAGVRVERPREGQVVLTMTD